MAAKLALLPVCSDFSPFSAFSAFSALLSLIRPVVLILEIRLSMIPLSNASSSVLLRCFSMLLEPSNWVNAECLDSRSAMRSLQRLQCHSDVGTYIE